MKVLLVLTCSLLLSHELHAQLLRKYVFFAPAPNNGTSVSAASFGILPSPQPLVPPPNSAGNTYAAGVGLEERLSKLFGAGLDLAGILPGAGKIIPDTIGAISPNGYIHWPRSDWEDSKFDLYGTGGYTLLIRDFSANGFNVGGGMNYWFKDRLGITLEYRFLKIYGNPPPPAFASQYSEVRFGLTFR